MIRSRLPSFIRALTLATALLPLHGPAAGWAQEDEAAGVTPATPQPGEAPYFQARVSMTEIHENGRQTTTTFRIFRHGPRVRLESDQEPDKRFLPWVLYDYGKREQYRVLTSGDIVFAYPIPPPEWVQAQIRGLLPVGKDDPVYRQEINPALTFDGHPCTLILTGFPAAGRVHGLRWVWEAQDLGGAVVRVVTPQDDGTVLMVDYLGATDTPFDGSVLELPEGAPVMSGF